MQYTPWRSCLEGTCNTYTSYSNTANIWLVPLTMWRHFIIIAGDSLFVSAQTSCQRKLWRAVRCDNLICFEVLAQNSENRWDIFLEKEKLKGRWGEGRRRSNFELIRVRWKCSRIRFDCGSQTNICQKFTRFCLQLCVLWLRVCALVKVERNRSRSPQYRWT